MQVPCVGVPAALLDKSRAFATASWGERHDKEMLFQQAKHEMAKVKAAQQKLLVGPEKTRSLKRACRLVQRREKETRRSYEMMASKRRAAYRPAQRPSLVGQALWVDPRVQRPALREFMAVVESSKMRIVQDRCLAQVFVVKSVDDPGQRTLWSAILGGGAIVNKEYIETLGLRGRSLVYRRAVAMKRSFFLSEGFLATYPEMTRILMHMSAQPGSKFKCIRSQEQALATGERYHATKNDSEIFALCTVREQRAQETGNPPNEARLSVTSFHMQICVVALSFSVSCRASPRMPMSFSIRNIPRHCAGLPTPERTCQYERASAARTRSPIRCISGLVPTTHCFS